MGNGRLRLKCASLQLLSFQSDVCVLRAQCVAARDSRGAVTGSRFRLHHAGRRCRGCQGTRAPGQQFFAERGTEPCSQVFVHKSARISEDAIEAPHVGFWQLLRC